MIVQFLRQDRATLTRFNLIVATFPEKKSIPA
jgi:hypothetical protein